MPRFGVKHLITRAREKKWLKQLFWFFLNICEISTVWLVAIVGYNVITERTVYAIRIHGPSVLKQACSGRCWGSNVHIRPVVSGSIINLQFTVKHTNLALRTAINQYSDVSNLVKDSHMLLFFLTHFFI